MTVRTPWTRQGAIACVLLGWLAAPLAAQTYHLYWGDVHGHSALSDGKGTPAEYFRYARDVSHLDFAVLTDHDFGHTAPWRLPREAWDEIQDAAEENTKEGRFIAIAGYEWTSQPKYWKGFDRGNGRGAGSRPAGARRRRSESLFDGPPKFYNHKNVYFLGRVPYIFSAKDPATFTPELLAEAVRKAGGLIQNNHPSAGRDGRDQWAYSAKAAQVIRNTEMGPDTWIYKGRKYRLDVEKTVRAFLDAGGRTGFVKGSDTHEGKPVARTAVWARALTKEAIFEALRARRCYAVTHARIACRFRIQGAEMGSEVSVAGEPRLEIRIDGTAPIARLEIVKNGRSWRMLRPGTRRVRLAFADESFRDRAYYYLRIEQEDRDPDGNPSTAWTSPIWVSARRPSK